MILVLIFCYVLLGLYELIPLYKQKQHRDLGINSFLTVFSFAIAVLLTFGVEIPSPSEPIRQFILSIFRNR